MLGSRRIPVMMCLWNYNMEWTLDNHNSEINKMKSNLPVPSKIFPNDRHRDIHDVVGRPKLVQRAVLVVDTLQENLEIWNQEKCYTIGFRLMGSWQNYILKTFHDEPHLAHSVFLLSHQQPEQRKMFVLDGRWPRATILKTAKDGSDLLLSSLPSLASSKIATISAAAPPLVYLCSSCKLSWNVSWSQRSTVLVVVED